MPKFWVTYAIINGDGTWWPVSPIASAAITTPDLPTTEIDVSRMADGITEFQRSEGRIPDDAHVSILSWSTMGG